MSANNVTIDGFTLNGDDPAVSTRTLQSGDNADASYGVRAFGTLLKALSFESPAVRAHIYLANLYARERQYVQAADELHKYIEADPIAGDAAEMRKIEAQWRARSGKP